MGAQMYILLLTILVLDGLFLGVVILLQSGKGGGLAAMGGGAAATDILGGRQATTVLTRATWTAGTIFMVLAFVLSIMSSRATQPDSILQQDTNAPAVAPEPLLPPTGGAPGSTPAGAEEAPAPATQPSEADGAPASTPDPAAEEPGG
jgi:preprotein translocase subunit SecG